MTDSTLIAPPLPPVDLSPLLRPILFAEPERLAAPGAWVGHLPFAFWLADVLRPRLFVELGVHTGNSYCGFCQAVATLSLPTACYGIDTWQGDPQAGYYGEAVFAGLKDWHDRRYSAFSRLVRSSFAEALAHFPDGAIDLLHIDGYHTYEAVAEDFAGWRPKLSPRAIVLFHDINVRERDFGVWRLWQEVSPGRPHFAFLHGHGLGVLAVGRVDSAPLDWLFSAEDGEASAIRNLLARLGGVLEARTTLAEESDGLATGAGFEPGSGEDHRLIAARNAPAMERDALDEKIRAQQSEIDSLVTEVVARDRRLAVAREESRAAEDRHTAALAEMQALAATYARSQDETVERLHGLAAEACARRDAVGRELEALREDCRSRIAASERELALLKASTSWRLTGPLRAFGRLFKGG
ncbi:MAG: hypothetical protein GVY09_13285 [Gammaproteobacteria bacterium]|jgi:hypothetical protein|nr:hypothetical protein [Gammaproteobacteria bacterium]